MQTTRFFSSRAACALAMVVACTVVQPVRAQQPTAAPGARATAQGILIDFQDAEVRSVITALAEAAGINVTYGDLPSRRITLRIRQPVPVDSVRALLRSVAESNGLKVTDTGSLLRFDAIAAPVTPSVRRRRISRKYSVRARGHRKFSITSAR